MALGQWAWVSVVLLAGGFAACSGKSFGVATDSPAEGGAGPNQGGSLALGGTRNQGGTRSQGGSGGSAATPTAGNATVTPAEAGAGDGGQSTVLVPPPSGPQNIGHSEFHDSASGSDNAAGHLTDATFIKPEGTLPGDLMLVFFGCDHQLNNLNGSELEKRGWTLVDQHEQLGSDGQGTYLLYRFVDGTEPNNIVFKDINDPQYANGVQGLLTVYRGVSRSAPVNAYEVLTFDTGSENSQHIVTPTPAITTTVDNCLLVAGLSPDTAIDRPEVTAWPEGFDENRISVVNPAHPYPFAWANIYSAERPAPRAGKVPGSHFDWDITYDGSNYYGSLSFVLALAPQ